MPTFFSRIFYRFKHRYAVSIRRRCVLIRAHQGMVIFIPQGDAGDATRLPGYLDGTFEYLVVCGVEVLK